MATLLRKAFRQAAGIPANLPNRVQKASRGTISSYVNNAPPEYGQPRPSQSDVTGLITPERQREIIQKTPTPAACVNATLDFGLGVEIKVRNVDSSQPADPAKVQYLKSFMIRPNPEDNWYEFRDQVFRDLTSIGWAAVEIERDADGNPANLWPLDAARLYIDFDEHGTILGYDMLDSKGFPIHGADGEHAWEPEEIILFRRDAQTNSRYPSSRITQLFPAAVIENMMLAFIGSRFTDSNVPYGVFDMGDITPEEQQKAIASWNSQARKQHRIIITGSKGSKWFPFGYALSELEAKDLLNQIRGYQMAILGVTMNELGESQDINKSNGYNLSYTFKKRAVEPLLTIFTATMTKRFLVETLGWSDMEYTFEEIDSRDELLQAQVDEAYAHMGVSSINKIRNRRGEPSVPGGDEPAVFTGSAWIPVSMIPKFAQVQYDALAAVVEQTEEAVAQAEEMDGQAGAEGGKQPGAGMISSPLVRPPKMPMSMTTPDGSGSSTTKVKYPKAQLSRDATGGKNPAGQKARGTVQAARNAGVRND